MTRKIQKQPSPWVSAIPLAVLTLLLYVVIRAFGGDAINGGSQIALLSATSVCVMLSIGIYRCRWAVLEEAIIDNIRASASAILILLLIGAISGTWMVSGVVPTMIHYGLEVLHPSFFLVASCAICAVVSLMTGSSWTTIATIGVALMGIGRAMEFPEGWVAGAIISGAYFGDKLSLLSDTTVLASSTVGVPLFTHIRYMLYTTVPSMAVALGVFTAAGFWLDHGAASESGAYAAALASSFHLSPWLLLVPLATGILIARKLPAIVTLFCAVVFACVAMLLVQPDLVARVAGVSSLDFMSGFKGVLMSCFGPTALPTGSAELDALHERHAQYRVADHLRHVLRRRDDRQRHAAFADRALPALRSSELLGRGLDGRRRHLLQSLYGRPVHLDHPLGTPVQGSVCRAGIRGASAEPLGRGFGHGLLGARAVELVRHDAGHGAGRLDLRLSALLYFQYRLPAHVAARCGSGVGDRAARRAGCGPGSRATSSMMR